MKLKTALEIGKTCGLETIGESLYNIQIHSPSLFTYPEIIKELGELILERDDLFSKTDFTNESKIEDILSYLTEQYKQNPNFQTDKKLNAAYWDVIDNIIEEAIMDIADMSVQEIHPDLYGDGIVPNIREILIKYLKEAGGEFPYVDENL